MHYNGSEQFWFSRGHLNVKSFEELCTGIRYELKRELKEEEIAFLQWVHQRQAEESEKKDNPKSE